MASLRTSLGFAVVCVLSLLVLFPARALAQATPCADLLVTGITIAPETPVAGESADISISVRNGGTCAAGGFVVQFKSDRAAPTGPSRSIDGLAAGQET